VQMQLDALNAHTAIKIFFILLPFLLLCCLLVLFAIFPRAMSPP
jgi:hypothetical protein